MVTGLFSRNIGVDLGTVTTLVYVKGKGIVLREPSVVALERGTDKILAAGKEAYAMIGRTPEDIVIVKPIRDGVISNFNTTKIMLQEFFSRIYPGRLRLTPLNAIVSVSLDVTEIEKRAVIEAARQAGAKKVYLVENSIAGAIGINLPIVENCANMVVDLGGGTSEAAVIALGGIVTKNTARLGGEHFNKAISSYLRKKYNFLVGERTAEKIKINIGNALQANAMKQKMEVMGTNLSNRMPGKLFVDSCETGELLSSQVNSLTKMIIKTLEETPVELVTEIMDKGIILTGGGALLKNLTGVFADETNIPVTVAEYPMDSVALGTGKMLSALHLWKKLA